MKVTIDTVRGVTTTRDDDGIVINGPLILNGPVTTPGVIVTTATASLSASHTLVATAGNCVFSLPDAATVDQQEFKVKKTSAVNYSLTISPANGQLIDDQTSLIVTAQYTAVTLYAMNGAWHIF